MSYERERPTDFRPRTEPWTRPSDFVPVESASTNVSAEAIVYPLTNATGEPSAPREEGAAAESVEQERVTVSGRVGKTPMFSLTRNHVPRAKFPIGLPDERNPGKKIWRDVLAFRERAIYARDHLHIGDSVEIIGYERARIIEGTRGPRTIIEITAAVIKRRS
ncbi:MAG: single-stranded DNA-binding protein [Dehalococcoidia bacterium]